MRILIEDAIRALHPDAQFTMVNDDITEWHSPDITQPDREELNAKVTELENAEPYRLLRIERDRLIGQSDWRIVMAKEAGTNIPAAWKTYRQALRDLPSTQDPVLDSNNPIGISSVTWPSEPSS